MGTTLEAERTEPAVGPGTPVEVRRRFDQRWTRGFEVADVVGGRYRLKRLSDGEILPADFDADEIRPERKRRQGMWWA